jgi:hypothetical protein
LQDDVFEPDRAVARQRRRREVVSHVVFVHTQALPVQPCRTPIGFAKCPKSRAESGRKSPALSQQKLCRVG